MVVLLLLLRGPWRDVHVGHERQDIRRGVQVLLLKLELGRRTIRCSEDSCKSLANVPEGCVEFSDAVRVCATGPRRLSIKQLLGHDHLHLHRCVHVLALQVVENKAVRRRVHIAAQNWSRNILLV